MMVVFRTLVYERIEEGTGVRNERRKYDMTGMVAQAVALALALALAPGGKRRRMLWRIAQARGWPENP